MKNLIKIYKENSIINKKIYNNKNLFINCCKLTYVSRKVDEILY